MLLGREEGADDGWGWGVGTAEAEWGTGAGDSVLPLLIPSEAGGRAEAVAAAATEEGVGGMLCRSASASSNSTEAGGREVVLAFALVL
jgi:hypothetical protein